MNQNPHFPSTCWSQVRILPGASSAAGRAAFEVLARRYLGPIRAWLRTALGLRADDGDELAQDFFAWAMDSHFLAKADPGRGSFRAFLKTALRNYATDRARRAQADKRGGSAGTHAFGADGDSLPDARAVRPDQELDAEWRAAVIERALETLREDLEGAGRGHVYAVFRAYYLDPGESADHRALAQRFAIKPTDVSNYLARAKRAYREHLRAQVLATVGSFESLDGELRWLLDSKSRGSATAGSSGLRHE